MPYNLYVKRVKTAQRTVLIRLNLLLGGNYWRITMDTFELLQDEMLKLRMNNQQPKYIYVGEFEYRELKGMADRATSKCKDEFMGIEVVRVNRNNHVNVTA